MSRPDPQTRTLSAARLRAALQEAGGTARPDYLDDIVAQAEHTPQRPALTFPERWNPMAIAIRHDGFPRVAILAAVTLILIGLISATVSVVGIMRPPAPIGVANGLIAFGSGGDIVAVRPDGTGLQTLVDLEPSNPVGPMAFSPDGRQLAYWARKGSTWDLVVTEADGSDPVTIVTAALDPSATDWSPDGSQLAYADRIASFQWQIFVAPLDGTGPRAIGDPELHARPPVWSPDGSTIAFGAKSRGTENIWQLYLMDADGSNVRRVSNVRGDAWAFIAVDWSHDGSKIVGQASDADDLQEWDIWVIDVADGSATDVGAHIGGDEVFPSWAPDRDAISWAHDGSIVLLEPGGQPVDLPIRGSPVWSPDGRRIATQDGNELVVLDLDTGVRISVPGIDRSPIWQPVLSSDD